MHILLKSQVKDMYFQGYSIKYIVDYVYKKLNSSCSNIGANIVLYNDYSKDYCRECVYNTILEINNSLEYIV